MANRPPVSAAPANDASQAPHPARRWWALIAIAASMLVVGLDLTVLSLALPTISADLHASTGDLQWISDAYSLVLAAAILPAGLLGDRYGRKRVLLIALALFGVSSALCAYAASVGELIAARALLGIGAAAIMPLALSVIPVLFTAAERPKAIVVITSTTFISFPIGPIVGGVLLDHFWWGSVFLINVPVVIIALIAVAFLMPESRSARKPSLDLVGVLISSAGLTGVTYGVIKAGQDGWSDAVAVATLLAGLVVLALFVLWERRVVARGSVPLVDLGLFRSPGFRWGTILVTLVSFAMFGLLFAMPQYFQGVRGTDALGSGLRLLPLVAGMLVGSIGASRVQSPRKGSLPAMAGARPVVTLGYLVMAVAMAIGAFTTVATSNGYTLAWIAMAGLGLGLAMPSAMNVAMGALSAERSGSGSALISALRQVGATIGVAVLGTVISNGYRGGLAVNTLPAPLAAAARSGIAGGVAVARRLGSASLLDEVRTAFVHGMDSMLWVCGGIALAAALLAVVFLPRRGAASEEPASAAASAADSLPV